MKHTRVLNLNCSKTFSLLRNNYTVVIFTFLFLSSLLTGCIIFKNSTINLFAEKLFNLYFLDRSEDSFFRFFITEFISSSVFLFAAYFFGTSVIGIAFIPAVILSKGVFTGLFLSYLYASFGFQAITYNLLIFIPSMTISVIVLILACSESIKLSFILGKYLFSEGQSVAKDKMRKFLLIFCLLISLTVLSSLINALLSFAFMNYFSFR